jgi:uncharacterized protein
MVYHEGELAMQRRAGVEERAERVARIIGPRIPPAAAAFLAMQRFVVTASVDRHGAVTASLIAGPAGFASPRGEGTVLIDCAAGGTTPAAHVERILNDVDETARIGFLAIELPTRRRMRLNGAAVRQGDTIRITPTEVYSNCPRYIHPRLFDGEVEATESSLLTQEQQRWIAEADTFFVATFHPDHGADASHRGGDPGFVRVESPTRLVWPDYPGNNMFNTLGNLVVNPRCGLLFVDFERRQALQLHGRATVEGDEERRVVFELEG